MSNSTISTNIAIDVCKVVSWSVVDVDYWPIGSASDYEGRMILLQNWTDADLWFSDDPACATGKFPLKAGASIILDICTNQSFGRGVFWPNGAVMYVKLLGTPTTGNIYLTVFYGNP